MPKGETPSEFEIIARYLAPLAKDTPGAEALLDDAAQFTPERGDALVLTMDSLVAGVHFRPEDRPEHVARKALAVNISDLAAKAAEPLVYLLSMALPGRPDAGWLDAFATGLREAQEAYGCRLAGGDTIRTPGPLSLSITAVGRAGDKGMVRRAGAKPGDRLFVTGSIGDAALGLRLLQDEEIAEQLGLDAGHADHLRRRYWLPEPRLAAVPLLRAHASAAMDVSDGLVGDLSKLCDASNVGAEVEVAKVPLSEAAAQALNARPELLGTVLGGGDDYEILAAVPESEAAAFETACRSADLAAVSIGRVVGAGAGVVFTGRDGQPLRFAETGFDHFGPRDV